jgi:hypothetical protein
MNIQPQVFRVIVRRTEIAQPARLQMAAVRFSPPFAAERATRRPLSRLVWVCLWIVLIQEFIPPVGGILSSLHITLLVRLTGLFSALILTRSILTDWSVCWPFLFASYVAVTEIVNRLFLNRSQESGLIDSIYGIAVCAAIYLMIIASVSSRRRFILLSLLLMANAIFDTGYFFWDNYVSGNFSAKIIVQSGLLANRNYLSPILLSGLIACFSLFELCHTTLRQWVLNFIVGGLYIGAFFTGSRGTILVTTLLIGLWLVSSKSRGRAIGFGVVGLILAGLWLFQNQDIVSFTLGRLQEIDYEEITGETRYQLIFDALDLWSENPLLGAGLGATLQRTAHAPHASFTGLLAETGIFGFSLFYIPAVMTLIKSFSMSRQGRSRTRNDLHRVLRIFVIGLVAFLFEGLFEETYIIRNFYIHIGLLYALMHASWLRSVELRVHLQGSGGGNAGRRFGTVWTDREAALKKMD